MEEFIILFTKYIKENYDTDNTLILDKYYHSLRVANIMMDLAKRKGLSDYEISIAFVIGLFHDLGRFYEVKKNKIFHNRSLDHGSYSNKILYNDNFISEFDFSRDEQIDLIIRKALYYHNKLSIDNRVKKEKEELFVKLLRDADKLDIVDNRIKIGNLLFKDNPTGYVIRNFMNDQAIELHFVNTKSDSVIFYLSFIKDLYFEESREIGREKHLLERFVQEVKVGEENEKLFKILINHINETEEIKDSENQKKISYYLWKVKK